MATCNTKPESNYVVFSICSNNNEFKTIPREELHRYIQELISHEQKQTSMQSLLIRQTIAVRKFGNSSFTIFSVVHYVVFIILCSLPKDFTRVQGKTFCEKSFQCSESSSRTNYGTDILKINFVWLGLSALFWPR